MKRHLIDIFNHQFTEGFSDCAIRTKDDYFINEFALDLTKGDSGTNLFSILAVESLTNNEVFLEEVQDRIILTTKDDHDFLSFRKFKSTKNWFS